MKRWKDSYGLYAILAVLAVELNGYWISWGLSMYTKMMLAAVIISTILLLLPWRHYPLAATILFLFKIISPFRLDSGYSYYFGCIPQAVQAIILRDYYTAAISIFECILFALCITYLMLKYFNEDREPRFEISFAAAIAFLQFSPRFLPIKELLWILTHP
jgi:hypothetical protein